MKMISNVIVLTFAFSSANGKYFIPTCSNSAGYTSWGGGVRTVSLPASACLQTPNWEESGRAERINRYHNVQGAWDSQQHMEQATGILIDTINCVGRNHSGWSLAQKTKGGVSGYNAGCGNVQTYDGMISEPPETT